MLQIGRCPQKNDKRQAKAAINNRLYNIKQQDNGEQYIVCLNLPIQEYAPTPI